MHTNDQTIIYTEDTESQLSQTAFTHFSPMHIANSRKQLKEKKYKIKDTKDSRDEQIEKDAGSLFHLAKSCYFVGLIHFTFEFFFILTKIFLG